MRVPNVRMLSRTAHTANSDATLVRWGVLRAARTFQDLYAEHDKWHAAKPHGSRFQFYAQGTFSVCFEVQCPQSRFTAKRSAHSSDLRACGLAAVRQRATVVLLDYGGDRARRLSELCAREVEFHS